MALWSDQDQHRVWDVAIVGAGMGGGVTARSLADAGWNVLLIDRGNHVLSASSDLRGATEGEKRLARGEWPVMSTYDIDGVVKRRFGPYGAGIGGGTNLYAAALERFERHDVESVPGMPHPTGGWPISYDTLVGYYERAEQILHVAGTKDPLNEDPVDHLKSPAPMGPSDAAIMRSLTDSGMHPYRMHVGIRYRPGCDECVGRLCLQNCRADVRSVLADGKADLTIMERGEVLRLKASADRVQEAVVICGDRQISIHARVFVLAAGAIHTPKVLLQSRGEHWPNGLANESGTVGCKLMFHGFQRFAIWSGKRFRDSEPRKSISFRDFYKVDGERLGSAQSMAFKAGYGDLLVSAYQAFDRSAIRGLRLLRPLLRIPAALASALLGSGAIFTTIIEDLPYTENRVVLDENEADGVRIIYRIPDELRKRGGRLRSLLKQRLGRSRVFFLSQAVELNLGHACGTCAMGDDPNTSVINRDCQAHGISNLFIVDGSFMPTSASINPALTIAANALRVSETIKNVLDNKSAHAVKEKLTIIG